MTPQPAPVFVRAHSTAAHSTAAPRSPERPLAAILAAALVIAALLLSLFVNAGTARGATVHRTRAELSYSRSVLRMINAERRAHHLRPLRYDYRLRVSARRHNLTMARANMLAHQLPGEADFTRRISAAGYRWHYVGENIGWNSEVGRRGVLLLETIMYNEKAPNDGHRRNILSRNYRNVGVDVYVDKVHHKIWLTTDFGRR